MNKASSTIKQIVCFVDGVDLTDNSLKLDTYSNLNKALKEGSSVILLDKKPKSANLSPLISLLWFNETLANGISFDGTILENQLKIFDTSKTTSQEKQGTNDEDENTGVKFLRKPKTISEISDAKICIVTQSEDIAKFAEVAEINYIFEKDSSTSFDSLLEEVSAKLNGLDLAILHLDVKGKSLESAEKTLAFLDVCVGKHLNTSSLKIIYSLFAEKTPVSEITGIHREQLKNFDSEIRSLVEKIIPRQSWEYTQGEVNDLFVEDKENLRFCLCNYHAKINRTDKITSFEMLKDKASWSKIGGNIIWIAGLLREIMFELGKFPKFGA